MGFDTKNLRIIAMTIEERERVAASWIREAANIIDAQTAEVTRLREALRIAVGALDNAADHSPTVRRELRFHANAVRASLRETCHD